MTAETKMNMLRYIHHEAKGGILAVQFVIDSIRSTGMKEIHQGDIFTLLETHAEERVKTKISHDEIRLKVKKNVGFNQTTQYFTGYSSASTPPGRALCNLSLCVSQH